MINKERRLVLIDIFAISLLYIVSYSFLLINNGLYWDDWVWAGRRFEDYIEYSQLLFASKVPTIFFVFSYMLPPVLSRFLIFTAYYIPGLVLYSILKRQRVDRITNLLIVVLFLLLPLNIAKYTLSTGIYAFCFCIFSIAVWLLANYHDKSLQRIVSLVLFYISFYMNSLLVFYAIPFLFLFFMENKNLSIVELFKFIRRNLDYFVLPFIFFIIKKYLEASNAVFINGVYNQDLYNNIQLTRILLFPIETIKWFGESFLFLFYNLLLSVNGFFGIMIMVIAMPLLWYTIFRLYNFKKEEVFYPKLIFLGIIFFLVASFPYIAVGKDFSTNVFNTRHQFLFPLSFSMIITGIVGLLKRMLNVKICIFISSMIISMCICFNIVQGNNFYSDYIKQQSIILNMEKNKIIKENHFIIINDSTKALSNNRRFSTYELSGFAKEAFNNEKHVLVDSRYSNINFKQLYQIKDNLPYNYKDIPPFLDGSSVVNVSIEESWGTGTIFQNLKLINYKLFNTEKYLEYLQKYIKISNTDNSLKEVFGENN